jgi:hypothetical protein
LELRCENYVVKTVEDIREAFVENIRPQGIRYFVTLVADIRAPRIRASHILL